VIPLFRSNESHCLTISFFNLGHWRITKLNSNVMKTEKELNADILELTLKIKNDYPELSKYLKEIPVSILDQEHPEINIKVLQEYYEYLESILEKYGENHI
jgi:hypothetical protein